MKPQKEEALAPMGAAEERENLYCTLLCSETDYGSLFKINYQHFDLPVYIKASRLQLKCDGTL